MATVIRILWLGCWLALPAMAVAAGPSDQLKELRGRIDRLQQQLTESEESKSEASDALRESERAISNVNRRLFVLETKQRGLREALARLDQQTARIRDDADKQEALLARLLYQQYLSGQPEALRLIASQQDSNQVARQLHYLTYVSRARAELITALRRDAADLERLSSEAQANSHELARLQSERVKEKGQLQRERQQHASMLKQVSDQISRQRNEISQLKRNEERLAKLVDRLARELARAPARQGRTRNEQVPEPLRGVSSFPALKGRLRLPVTGELVNQFGSPRADTGLSWKGLFIAANQGQEVKAVAAGRVVFADWLRGFGNLMILDHGGGYMSLYGNNEALLRQVGDTVKAGDPIAAVGASGGNSETGLYFELRFQGKPFDPLTWANLK